MIILALLQQAAESGGSNNGLLIGGAAGGVSGVVAFAKYLLDRFSRLEDQVMKTSNDVSLIVGHLGIGTRGEDARAAVTRVAG